MRDPSRVQSVLDAVPPELREAVAAILAREGSVCCPVAILPGSTYAADLLERDGWGVLWATCPDGPSVTLTPLACERLEVAIAEQVRVQYRQETYRDERGKRITMTMREIEESPEWRDQGDVSQVRIPRSTGFVALPEPHRVAAPVEPPRASIAAQVEILGRVVALLRPRKKKAKKAHRKSA